MSAYNLTSEVKLDHEEGIEPLRLFELSFLQMLLSELIHGRGEEAPTYR